jgi:PAS domain-containing protein
MDPVMYAATALAENIMLAAVEAARGGEGELAKTLGALDAPMYATNARGVVSYFNRACVGFAGRLPAVGKDRWNIAWRLYTDAGTVLPHANCPMAVAIREKRPVRGVTARAERPDGTWVSFMPLPTPLIDRPGKLRGAVSMLIDVTEVRRIAELRRQAERCIRLAQGFLERATSDALTLMAAEYQSRAADLERAAAPSPYIA